MNYINSMIQSVKILLYQFSKNKRQLDSYINRIRRLESLSTPEWENFKVLAKREADILAKIRDTREDEKEYEGSHLNGETQTKPTLGSS